MTQDQIASSQWRIFGDVVNERNRQNSLHPEPLGSRAMNVFLEELGEYSQSLLEGDGKNAKKELVEAIAVLYRIAEENYYGDF